MRRLLITGANGQLGNELRFALTTGKAAIGPIDPSWADVEVVYTDVEELDITKADDVMDFVRDGAFDAIINCAAATNVDGCEARPEFAYTLNAEAPANLARAAEAVGAKYVQVSTDYVLAGTDPEPQTEDAPCAPNTVYGETKLAGENAALELCSRTFVVRTAWLYGTKGGNFIRTMARLGRERGTVSVVCDQHGSPTFAGDLAYEILALLLTEDYGIYHCTNNGDTTWDVFARRIMEAIGSSCEVISISTEEYKRMVPTSAPRPLWSILDNKHLRDTIGDSMRDWDVAFDDFVRNVEL